MKEKPPIPFSTSSSNSSTIPKDKYAQSSSRMGISSMISCCVAPELRPSPTNHPRGSNVWSEKEYNGYHRTSTSEVQKRQFPILCHAENAQGRPPRPFASNPLLDRDDSLVQQGSLLSLVASDCESKRSFDDESNTVPHTPNPPPRKPKPFESSPLIGRDDSLVQGGSLLSLIATQDEDIAEEDIFVPSTPQISYAKYDSMLLQTPSGDTSLASQQQRQGPMPPPPSPALELSMAKRQAGQMMGKLNMRRELSGRGSLFQKVDSEIGSGNISVESRLTKNENDSSLVAAEDKSAASLSLCEVALPPIWKEDDNIHPELKGTYCYPRLFAADPLIAIEQGEMPWWYRLSMRMETTLSHTFKPYWREQLESVQHREDTNNISANTASNESGQVLDMTDNNHPCSPDAIVDLCSDSTPRRLRQMQLQGADGSVNRYASFNKQLSEVSPVNAWSEPEASTMKVRGITYAMDGVKVESDTALFACLGVDSFVNGEGGSDDHSNTAHYFERWKRACEKESLDRVPFLLVINFVVPWGSFQSYSIRPDADDGPFSSRLSDRPSEKAWRAFMEGDAEYRNKCLKLIPRVCAGPWVVKKMVGSTPALIGTKLPVAYRGSVEENYLEITMDVTKGPAFGNTVANTVVGKADVVTVDLGFVIEGQENVGTLPEQMLSLIRLHHLEMKSATTVGLWREEVDERPSERC